MSEPDGCGVCRYLDHTTSQHQEYAEAVTSNYEGWLMCEMP